jgi:4-hydroxy-2-oxoheptanedioate aldolase
MELEMEPLMSKVEILKKALASGPCFGLNCAIPSPHTVEILASSSYDFLVIDAEHPPTNPAIIHTQLTAMAASPSATLIKLPSLDPTFIRQCLDLGAEGLLAPDINTADDARHFVSSTRYPPHGTRGIASAVRVTGYTRNKHYVKTADQRLCRGVLIESKSGLDHLDEISAVDGIDIVMFGPTDLAAQLGQVGEPKAPQVVVAIEDGIKRVREAGRVTGIVSSEADIEYYAALGVTMFIVSSDVTLFVQATDGLVDRLLKKYRLSA